MRPIKQPHTVKRAGGREAKREGACAAGEGDEWSNAVPAAEDLAREPGARSQQMEGFPFVDQGSSPMAHLEGRTAESITNLKRQLDGLERGLERFGGRHAKDRAGLKRHVVSTQTRGRDSIVCTLPVLADLASGK